MHPNKLFAKRSILNKHLIKSNCLMCSESSCPCVTEAFTINIHTAQAHTPFHTNTLTHPPSHTHATQYEQIVKVKY